MKILIYILFLSTLFINCERNTTSVESDSLYGTWVEQDWQDGIQFLKKASKFDDNKYGFKILSDGSFVEHANSGFCATPPIAYAKYDGSCQFISSDSLHIEVSHWAGTKSFDIKIVNISSSQLQIKQSNYNLLME